MLTIHLPSSLPIFFSFSFYLSSFTFQKKIWKFRGGGGVEPPLKYALGDSLPVNTSMDNTPKVGLSAYAGFI